MTLRYGLIGTGMMGQEHIRNVALLDGVSITALCDPDEEMRNAAADLTGSGPATYSNLSDMLSADLADAYIIASPNHTHADTALAAVATGKPLLIEKPLCTALDDCRVVKLAAEKKGVPVWVAMEYRYMPAIARMLEDIQNGAVGNLKTLSIIEHRFPFLSKVGNWNRFAANSGGTLVEKCCHFFDLMRFIIGAEATRIYASGAQDVNHLDETYDGAIPDILDNAFVIVDFANGRRASLDLCMFAEGSYFQEIITAIGDRAKIEARVPGPDRFAPGGEYRESRVVISSRDPAQPEISVPVTVDDSIRAAGDHHGSTFFQHQGFLETVRTGRAPAVSLLDGLKAVQMGAAAEQSVRTGQPIALDG